MNRRYWIKMLFGTVIGTYHIKSKITSGIGRKSGMSGTGGWSGTSGTSGSSKRSK